MSQLRPKSIAETAALQNKLRMMSDQGLQAAQQAGNVEPVYPMMELNNRDYARKKAQQLMALQNQSDTTVMQDLSGIAQLPVSAPPEGGVAGYASGGVVDDERRDSYQDQSNSMYDKLKGIPGLGALADWIREKRDIKRGGAEDAEAEGYATGGEVAGTKWPRDAAYEQKLLELTGAADLETAKAQSTFADRREADQFADLVMEGRLQKQGSALRGAVAAPFVKLGEKINYQLTTTPERKQRELEAQSPSLAQQPAEQAYQPAMAPVFMLQKPIVASTVSPTAPLGQNNSESASLRMSLPGIGGLSPEAYMRNIGKMQRTPTTDMSGIAALSKEYEDELAGQDKEKKSDFNQMLINAGLGMMANKNESFLGGVGESLQPVVQDYAKTKAGRKAERRQLKQGIADLAMRQEDIRGKEFDRAANLEAQRNTANANAAQVAAQFAAAQSKGDKGAFTVEQAAKQFNDEVQTLINAEGSPDPLTRIATTPLKWEEAAARVYKSWPKNMQALLNRNFSAVAPSSRDYSMIDLPYPTSGR